MANGNILDENLVTDKRRELAILERNRLEVIGKLKIPRFAMFFWTVGFLILGFLAELPIAFPFGIAFLLCGIFIMKHPVISTITSVVAGTIYILYFILLTGNFTLGPRDFLPFLIYLILCVGVVNAFRLKKIKEQIKELS